MGLCVMALRLILDLAEDLDDSNQSRDKAIIVDLLVHSIFGKTQVIHESLDQTCELLHSICSIIENLKRLVEVDQIEVAPRDVRRSPATQADVSGGRAT